VTLQANAKRTLIGGLTLAGLVSMSACTTTGSYSAGEPTATIQSTYAPAEPAQTGPTRKQRYLGRASYICSPSGFGQKSRCFRRTV